MYFTHLEKIISNLRKAAQQYERTLLSGQIKNMEDYKGITGHLKGLLEAEEIVQEIRKSLIDPKPSEDDDDDYPFKK